MFLQIIRIFLFIAQVWGGSILVSNMAFISICEEECVILVILPPHSTDRLQPLAMGVYSPLATVHSKSPNAFILYGTAGERWIKLHDVCVRQSGDVSECLAKQEDLNLATQGRSSVKPEATRLSTAVCDCEK